jgi:hypothetical protein
MCATELGCFEEAMQIVSSWETTCSTRLLTTTEAASLAQSIAGELHAQLARPIAARTESDTLVRAYRLVDQWTSHGQLWRLNAAEAASLTEGIAQALTQQGA